MLGKYTYFISVGPVPRVNNAHAPPRSYFFLCVCVRADGGGAIAPAFVKFTLVRRFFIGLYLNYVILHFKVDQRVCVKIAGGGGIIFIESFSDLFWKYMAHGHMS